MSSGDDYEECSVCEPPAGGYDWRVDHCHHHGMGECQGRLGARTVAAATSVGGDKWKGLEQLGKDSMTKVAGKVRWVKQSQGRPRKDPKEELEDHDQRREDEHDEAACRDEDREDAMAMQSNAT
jgi:hypothetical protein